MIDLVVPERSYVVCATPRSGSTLLCRTLAELGVAGVPEAYLRRASRRARRDDPAITCAVRTT
jgi:LPS sulfotransferase NodH